MIVVIPSGGSNLGSIVGAFSRLKAELVLSEDPEVIRQADKVVLPGVGHAATMMKRLRAQGLVEVICSLTQPVLGICLGMQLFFESSEEGAVQGLGIIPGQVVAIPKQGLALPHMGWNRIVSQGVAELSESVKGQYCYFVHSYMAEDGPWTRAYCEYGCRIPAIVQWRNFYGTQFHPERSGAAGEALLSKFICLTL